MTEPKSVTGFKTFAEIPVGKILAMDVWPGGLLVCTDEGPYLVAKDGTVSKVCDPAIDDTSQISQS